MSYECVLIIIKTSTTLNIYACLIFWSLHKPNTVKHFLWNVTCYLVKKQLIYHVTYFAHAFKSSLIHLFCRPYVFKLNVYIKAVLTTVCTNIR